MQVRWLPATRITLVIYGYFSPNKQKPTQSIIFSLTYKMKKYDLGQLSKNKFLNNR
ncbi:hypothetical protein DDI_2203 [Dickeya dianthicola RNS04.9]|nr:hypothetical protein DDI_2203 [Dickeya dianthicola RNS04.9]